jgi:DNA helicase HerA-like ATPase
MKVNLHEKRFVILGLQGSGKSTLAKYLARQNPKSLVFDIIGEYQGLNRYVPKQKQGIALQTELELCINRLLLKNLQRFDTFIIDEANRVAPSKKPLTPSLLMLNDQSRHFGLSLGTIARRPSQLNTDLMDLAHYLFIFTLSGWHDKQYLNKISVGLGDEAQTLEPYHFIMVDPVRKYWHMNPIPL